MLLAVDVGSLSFSEIWGNENVIHEVTNAF